MFPKSTIKRYSINTLHNRFCCTEFKDISNYIAPIILSNRIPPCVAKALENGSIDGFKEVIGATFPFSKIQRCIIHQIRSSMKYVPYKDKKAFVADLKSVYTAVTETVAIENLIEIKGKWDSKYHHAIKSWEGNWDNLSTFFEFSPHIRKIIYTTNVIESLNSQFRKVTKTKLIFPTDESLMKMLYLATERVHSKWTGNYSGWDLVINELKRVFADIFSKGA